jgi:hypothetical protein
MKTGLGGLYKEIVPLAARILTVAFHEAKREDSEV